MKKQTKSRAYLLALFVVFFAPLFFAMWLYYSSNSSLVIQTQNHGELVQPPRPLGKFSLTDNNGEVLAHYLLEGKWTFLYLGNKACDLYCEASLFKIRQVRLSLGHDSQRVQPKLLFIGDHVALEIKNLIIEQYTETHFYIISRTQFYSQLPQFKNLSENTIYLIDPLGNLMMAYTKDATAKGMKKDLKRLLKVSKIG